MNTKRKLIPPQPSSQADFPESTLTTPGMHTIPGDLSGRCCSTHTGIVYARKSDTDLHMHILEPRQEEGEDTLFPLIVFIQGAGWFQQQLGSELAQLASFARRGYVIAIAEHRSSRIAPFPGHLLDIKTALRYINTNAHTYHADPDRLTLWGNSSGGHSVVMTALTLHNPAFDEPSAEGDLPVIKAVVDYFGPTDISRMNEDPSTMDHIGPQSPEGSLIGELNVLENLDKAAATNPMNYITAEADIPPMLIFHGNKDPLVPFGQSILLFEALQAAGKTAAFYNVKGAGHGGPAFWTEPVFDIIEASIKRHI